MPLVDYSSNSDSEPGTDGPSPKRPKLVPSPATAAAPALPPLPPAFHDLYASTVRTAISDDPSLHQGRIRQIPHVAGNWPSHIYIEWHPDSASHSLLTSLLSALQENLRPQIQLNTFLTSDLGAPLPLHISLSRPISLTTANKDAFLSDLASSISGSGITPFNLSCRGVEWHRTHESGRSFLVLRVRSKSAVVDDAATNPELAGLLRRCNSIVDDYGQPQLYQWAVESGEKEDEPEVERQIGRAFHVSIAWSFAEPTEGLTRLTEEVFGETKCSDRIQQSTISVDGIKAKIGNIVTHIALPKHGRESSNKRGRNMLGF